MNPRRTVLQPLNQGVEIPMNSEAWNRRAVSPAPGGGDGGAGVRQVWGHTLTRCHRCVSSSLGPPCHSFVLRQT